MDFLSSAHVRWLLEHSVRCWVDKEWNPATLDSSGDVNSWMERVHAAVNDPSPEGNQTTLTSIWTPAGLQRHCLPCVFASVRWWFSLKRTCSIYWAPIHAYMCVCVRITHSMSYGSDLAAGICFTLEEQYRLGWFIAYDGCQIAFLGSFLVQVSWTENKCTEICNRFTWMRWDGC